MHPSFRRQSVAHQASSSPRSLAAHCGHHLTPNSTCSKVRCQEPGKREMDSGVPKDLHVELITNPTVDPLTLPILHSTTPKTYMSLASHTPQQSRPEYLHVAEAQTRMWTRSLYPICIVPHRKRRVSIDVPRNLYVDETRNQTRTPSLHLMYIGPVPRPKRTCHLPHQPQSCRKAAAGVDGRDRYHPSHHQTE
jgi:hypothetical protein